jgi:hypothetical protein
MSPDIPALPGFNLTTEVFLSPHGGSSDSCKGRLDSLCEWKRLVLRGRYRHRGICRDRSKPSRVRCEAKALGWAYFREPELNAVIEVVLKTRGRLNFGEYICSSPTTNSPIHEWPPPIHEWHHFLTGICS